MVDVSRSPLHHHDERRCTHCNSIFESSTAHAEHMGTAHMARLERTSSPSPVRVFYHDEQPSFLIEEVVTTHDVEEEARCPAFSRANARR